MAYLRFSLLPPTPPIHIVFCMVDHFEPGTGNVSDNIAVSRVARLVKEYPTLVARHKDYNGTRPKRTWFFPPHYHKNYHLRNLVSLCEQGYGEIELHLHHGKVRPDTGKHLRDTILTCVQDYARFGIFGQDNQRRRYAFIHGDWALDNSRHGHFCGVNNEIHILNETGCYADFTFPSPNESNPSMINAVYYATDDPHRPKSHATGVKVRTHGRQDADLMIVQGPMHPLFVGGRFSKPRIVGDSIDRKIPTDQTRIDMWVNTGIHITGARNIVLIKTHTHGATEADVVLGKEMDYIFSYLETQYNDGQHYRLHYVTARELYNIVKAIEAGEPVSNLDDYRDYRISPPRYNGSLNIEAASENLMTLLMETYPIHQRHPASSQL